MAKDDLIFRTASRNDVTSIVRLLADDPLGAKRERYQNPLPLNYYDAFSAIDADPNNELVVACNNEQVVGVLQLTFIPYLTYQGEWRAMFEWAIARAKQRGCHLVQLTMDKSRPDARRFYEDLGFQATHDGMKLHLK